MVSRVSFSVSLFVCCLWLSISPLGAVILFSTADPSKNTTQPGGNLAGSGWQYTGTFGPFAATAIGAQYFITVKHIGNPSNVFNFRGVDYPIVQWFDDPSSELRIFQISGTLPAWAPLYSRPNEAGLGLVVIGRGTRRGDPISNGGVLRGWAWGSPDGVQRWGQNVVARASGSDLYATFSQGGKPSEGTVSVGDSGGGIFIKDNGTWKLAGVSERVDAPVSVALGGPLFDAALFDERGFYDTNNHLISGTNAIPSGFHAWRISSQLPWIRSIVPASANTSSGIVAMTTPVPGTVLPSSSVTFKWTAGSARVYKIFVGTAYGAANIYNSGRLKVRTLKVNNIPTNGSAIYVRLWSKGSSGWVSVDYTYTAHF